MSDHHIELPRQSWRILAAHVTAGGDWCKSPKIIRDAAALLDQPPILSLDGEEVPAEPAALKPWMGTVLEAEVPEGQRDAGKVCLKAAVESGRIPPSRYAAQLLASFGVVD
jgi:hypothetical protein